MLFICIGLFLTGAAILALIPMDDPPLTPEPFDNPFDWPELRVAPSHAHQN